MLQSDICKPTPVIEALLAFDAYLDYVEQSLPEALLEFATLELYDATAVGQLRGILCAPLTRDVMTAIWHNQPLPNVARAYIEYTTTRLPHTRLHGDDDMLSTAIDLCINDIVLAMYKHYTSKSSVSVAIMNWAVHYGDGTMVVQLHKQGFNCDAMALFHAVQQDNLAMVNWLHINQPRQIAYPGVQNDVLLLCNNKKLSSEMMRYFDGESYRLLKGMYH